MLTLTLQYLVTLGFLAFALGALGVWRASAGSSAPAHRAAWLLAGGAFLMHAANKMGQEVFGTLAFAGGRESRVWARYLEWNAAFNHSRTFLLLAFCGTLIVLSLRREGPFTRTFFAWSFAAMAAGGAFGAVLGKNEEAFRQLTHYSAVARWDLVELVVLLGTLFACLLSSRTDRTLWFCLCVYAFSLALNVLWFAAFSRTNMPGEWAPRPWEIHTYRVALNALLAYLAWQRYRQARRGIRVPGLLEPPQPRIRLVG